jgi:hypothetical protein
LVKRLKELEAAQLRRAVSDLTLEKLILIEAASGTFTRPPFAHPECSSQMGDSFPLGARASPFLSEKVLQCRIVQHGVGQKPFQPRVLVSSVFSRLASETSIPPNFAFHL